MTKSLPRNHIICLAANRQFQQPRIAPHQLHFEVAVAQNQGGSERLILADMRCQAGSEGNRRSPQSQVGAFLLSLYRRAAIVRATD
jgi:hypothetical protein